MNDPNPWSRGIVRRGLWILALAVTACSSGTEPTSGDIQPGFILGFNLDDPRLVVPDTVQIGTEFVVEVTTYGNGCYTRGHTEVKISGNDVKITPFDHVDRGAGTCEDILLSFVHKGVVEFSEVGSASVVIVGRAGGSMERGMVEVTREVVVVPAHASH